MARNVLHRQSSDQGQALTHVHFLQVVLNEYKKTGLVKPVYVQVRKRGVVVCGRVLEAAQGSHDTDWFKVDCQLGQLWFAQDNVRLCSGQGCGCETPLALDAAQGRACATGAASSAVPLGNTGTTVVQGA